ncbi:MAG: RNA methyltransferase [Verrucomicrobiales bacterium]|jgi:tRNA G18 (ribose-2'-O)-methylase SpoU|nr:RNA methyltransferase [Verrucomicrobiales bacterium]
MNDRDTLLSVYQNDDNYRTSPWFICEGRWLVECLLEQPTIEVHSVVVIEGQHDALRDNVPDEIPALTVTQDEANKLLGFQFHRGVLAAARKPEPLSVRDWLSKSPQHLTDPRPWVIAPLLADPGNVGALIRNAAALGAGAVITSIAGASPWYRKAIRTSTGSAFRLPVVSSPCLDDDLKWLSEQQNIELVALALTDNAVSIQDFTPNAKKIVLLIGPEDHGLSEFWLDRCHQVVKIPMANGVDSLNAATSAAVALSRLTAIKG